jgi:hypothetical protein
MIPNLPLESLQKYTENPVLYLLSWLDPLTNILGWDCGMLSPGTTYTRQFIQDGVYFYSEGLGHTARVVVDGMQFILPLVRR